MHDFDASVPLGAYGCLVLQPGGHLWRDEQRSGGRGQGHYRGGEARSEQRNVMGSGMRETYRHPSVLEGRTTATEVNRSIDVGAGLSHPLYFETPPPSPYYGPPRYPTRFFYSSARHRVRKYMFHETCRTRFRELRTGTRIPKTRKKKPARSQSHLCHEVRCVASFHRSHVLPPATLDHPPQLRLAIWRRSTQNPTRV